MITKIKKSIAEYKTKGKSPRVFEHKLFWGWLCSIVVVLILYVLILYNESGVRDWIAEKLQNIWNVNPETVYEHMRVNATFWGEAVWTLATILAGMIVFFYGILGNKNFGVYNRTIIAYEYGSWYIPLVVILDIAFTLIMTFAYYLGMYSVFYISSCFSFVLQMWAIIVCIYSTSFGKSRRMILKVEKMQYEILQHILNTKEREDKLYEIEVERKQSSIIYHMELVVKGNETLTEKIEMIKDILLIPVKNIETNVNMQDKKYGANTIYFYIFQNMRILIEYANENWREAELQKIYSMLYEVIYLFHNNCILEKHRQNVKYFEIVYLSAIYQSIIPIQNLKWRWDFVTYTIDGILADAPEMTELIIGMLLCSLEFLDYRGDIDLYQNDSVENKIAEIRLLSLSKWNTWNCNDAMCEELRGLLQIWIRETTGNRREYWGRFYKLLQEMQEGEGQSFVGYLLYKRDGMHTDDTGI